MNKTTEILFATLRTALFGQTLPDGLFDGLTAEQWTELYSLAAKQGVLAICYDVISALPKEQQPPRNLNIQWVLGVEAIENRYELQLKNSKVLAEFFAEQNIKTVVLKGLAISTYYPVSNHRECGDLDCFLGDDYEPGNQICEQIGAKVKRDYYKNSHITYRGLMIENHRFCLPIRGNRGFKSLERHLEKVAVSDNPQYVADTKLIIPTPDFNALFLTVHALNHFLPEGIKLRHILDWALLLKNEQNNINWKGFYVWCDRLHLTRFANVLTAISVKYFGLQITNPNITTESEFAERVLDDVLVKSNSLFNKGYSPWKSRIKNVGNKFAFAWKYHKIYQKSVVIETLRSALAYFFDKKPKL